MSIAEHLIPEFDHEMVSTRALLERLPEAKCAWKPHPKSWTLGDLAVHVARIPSWCAVTLQAAEFDLNPEGGSPFPKVAFTTTAALVNLFDDNVREARSSLLAVPDSGMMETWTLKNAGNTLFSMPRIAVYRSMVMNHLIHHRGQLTVYARMNDVPLPAIYGPSADTPM